MSDNKESKETKPQGQASIVTPQQTSFVKRTAPRPVAKDPAKELEAEKQKAIQKALKELDSQRDEIIRQEKNKIQKKWDIKLDKLKQEVIERRKKITPEHKARWDSLENEYRTIASAMRPSLSSIQEEAGALRRENSAFVEGTFLNKPLPPRDWRESLSQSELEKLSEYNSIIKELREKLEAKKDDPKLKKELTEVSLEKEKLFLSKPLAHRDLKEFLSKNELEQLTEYNNTIKELQKKLGEGDKIDPKIENELNKVVLAREKLLNTKLATYRDTMKQIKREKGNKVDESIERKFEEVVRKRRQLNDEIESLTNTKEILEQIGKLTKEMEQSMKVEIDSITQAITADFAAKRKLIEEGKPVEGQQKPEGKKPR